MKLCTLLQKLQRDFLMLVENKNFTCSHENNFILLYLSLLETTHFWLSQHRQTFVKMKLSNWVTSSQLIIGLILIITTFIVLVEMFSYFVLTAVIIKVYLCLKFKLYYRAHKICSIFPSFALEKHLRGPN